MSEKVGALLPDGTAVVDQHQAPCELGTRQGEDVADLLGNPQPVGRRAQGVRVS